MSDATLSALLREAQRAGRLGVLSPGALRAIDQVTKTLSGEVKDCGVDSMSYVHARYSVDDDTGTFISTYDPGYTADDAREVGKFLRELLAVLG